MATVFLDEPKKELAEVDIDLAVTDPEQSVSQKALTKVKEVLDDVRLEFLLNLTATSESSEFQELDNFIKRTHEAVHQIIQNIGDIRLDSEPLQSGQQLLSAVSSHTLLRQHVKRLVGQNASLSTDIQGLDSSMAVILIRLDNYRKDVSDLEAKYNRK